MKKLQATPKSRYDKELKKHVAWWEYGDEHFPRTSYPAGTKTKKGEMVDMHTGEVEVNETADAIVDALLEGATNGDLSTRLAQMDDRKDQDRAKSAARRFLSKTKPKAYMVGDPVTIGMSVGGS